MTVENRGQFRYKIKVKLLLSFVYVLTMGRKHPMRYDILKVTSCLGQL